MLTKFFTISFGFYIWMNIAKIKEYIKNISIKDRKILYFIIMAIHFPELKKIIIKP